MNISVTGVPDGRLLDDGVKLLSYQTHGVPGLLVADIDIDAATSLLASRCRCVSL